MTAASLPLLITGVAGVTGYNAFHYFRQKHGDNVVGTRRANNWPLSGDGIHGIDTHDVDGMSRLFDEHEFQSVLYCEGTCKLKSCELDPMLAERVNVQSTESVLKAMGDRPVRLVFLSIDLVFSGDGDGGYTEQATPDPVTVYGKTMSRAEQIVLDKCPEACVLRISLPMGVSFNGHAGAIDWIQARFQKDKPATLYYDEVRTPTYTDCMNLLFEQLLTNDMSGLYHAGGLRNLSLYQIAQIVNKVGGYDPDLLKGCYRIEAGPMPPRAGNVTMDSSLLYKTLGQSPFDPWPLDDQFVPDDREWHYRRNGNFTGSPELLAEVLYRNPSRQDTAG